MNKTVLIFLGVILFLIVATVGGILWVRSKNNASNTNVTNTVPTPTPTVVPTTTGITPTPGGSPTPTGITASVTPTPASTDALPGVTKISGSALVSPALSYDGKSVWYFNSGGHLFRENLSSGLTQEFLLPSNLGTNVVIWPHSGSDFIIQTNSGTGKQFTYYNSATQKYIQYPPQIKEVDFMPDGTHVVYEWSDDTGNTLSSSNFDLTGHKTILALPDADDAIKVSPLGTSALLYQESNAGNGKLYYIPFDVPKLITIKTGTDNKASWGPDGQRFIFTKLDPAGQNSSQLWLGNISTAKDQALGINSTADRVAFDSSGQNVFIASAADGSSGDILYKFDLTNIVKTQLLASSSSSKINASDLQVAPDGSELYFVNDTDQFLYSLDLN